MTQIKRQRRTSKESQPPVAAAQPLPQKPTQQATVARAPLKKPPKGFSRVSPDIDTSTCNECYGLCCDHGHLEDCTYCIGPGEREVEYRFVDGVLYGRRVHDSIRLEILQIMWDQAVKH